MTLIRNIRFFTAYSGFCLNAFFCEFESRNTTYPIAVTDTLVQNLNTEAVHKYKTCACKHVWKLHFNI